VNRVAIIAPDFPPNGLPSALRLRFITPHLHEYGWEPTIITVDPRYYEPGRDSQSEFSTAVDMQIIRTQAVPLNIARRLGFSDIGLRTLYHHWRALSRLCKQRAVDVVFISVPPSFPMVLGRIAHARFHVPYVVDYQDPWVSGYHALSPTRERPGGRKWAVMHTLSRAAEPFAIRHVSHLTAVSTRTLDGLFDRYSWTAGTPVTEIPLGVEPDDFQFVKAYPRPNKIFDPGDGHLHLSSVGRGGVDLLPALRALFSAVQIGRSRSPERFSRLRMHFVGTTYAANSSALCGIMPLAHELGVADLVDEHPARVPYFDAIQLMLDSHGLLAIGSELPHYTASKIFPMIASGRPILGLFHADSTAVAILRETQAGNIVTFDSAHPPSDRVLDLCAAFETLLSGTPDASLAVKSDAFRQYTSRAMAARLAGVLDDCLTASADSSSRRSASIRSTKCR
jgi:Glycosyl transferase 4-like domain